MVFGVLLLVGTIHSTFDRLYDSIYGNTDVVVSGEQSVGSLPEPTIDRVRAVEGVEAAAGQRLVDLPHGRRATARSTAAQSAQLYVVGVDYAQPDTDERQAGRGPQPGRRPRRDRARRATGRSEHGVAVGDRVRLSTPTGIVTLRVAGLYEFEGGLDLGGYGTASMPVADARRMMDKPGVWDEINVVAADGASPDDAARAARRGARPRRRGRDAADQERRGAGADREPRRRPLLLLGHRAVRRARS